MAFFNKAQEELPEGTTVEREIKRSKNIGWRDVVVCLLIIGFFLLTKDRLNLGIGLGAYGGLSPVLEETRFGITGLDGNTHFFNYADASSIELYDDLKSFDRGEKVEGQENRQTISGTYRNSEFGEYQLHVQTKLHNYIVVHAPDGVLVFNLESDGTTQEMYRYFNELRNEQLSGTHTE